jgi:crotonobetainyl-CoA:carnitine CoA-transferase CaiB-like acyl-CoA transferase
MSVKNEIPGTRPLAGLRVVDYATGIPGRYCSRLLADAGAEVVRIHRASTAPDPMPNTEVALERFVDRGKVVVQATEDTQIHEIISDADVVTYDSSSDDATGLLIAQIHERNSRLISVHVTPFGETGPRADWKGDDLIAMSSGGLAHATPGLPDFSHDLDQEPPLRPDARVAELMSGVHAAASALLAIHARQRRGVGDHVDISMQEVIAALIPWDINIWTYGGSVVGRREVRAHIAPNAYLPGKDGWNVIVAFTEDQWQKLLDAMGNPEWAQSELFADGITRGENFEALHALLVDWLQTQGHWKLLQELQSRDIPSTPVLELADAFKNDHVRARRYFEWTDIGGSSKALLPGSVFVIDGQRPMSSESQGQESASSLIERWSAEAGRDHESPVPPDGRLPLEGITVLDFSQFVAMPLAGEWLALMGADVILVESRTNLASRRWAPFAGKPSPDTCGLFNNLNLAKKSVTINLKKPEGVQLARQIAAKCDLVLENFSPGTMERLGLGYEELRSLNPSLSMISLSAFGASGPWRDFAAFHSGVAALSGFAAVTGYADGYPRIVGAVAPDTIAASYCLLAALQAHWYRLRTGRGQHVQIAMSETLQSTMAEAISAYGFGEPHRRIGNRHRWKAPHYIYRCEGDDAWVAVSVGADEEWLALSRILGEENLGESGAHATWQARKRNEPEIDSLVARWAAQRTPEEAERALQEAGVPASKVFNARDIVEDPHLLERGGVVWIDHPKAGKHRAVAAPWRFQRMAPPKYSHAPLVGDGNRRVFEGLLGLTPEELKGLMDREIVR